MRVAVWLIGAFVALAPAACSSESRNPVSPKEQVAVFDSGRGTGQYDSMTYFKYASELVLTPQVDMTVAAIRPQIWFCNGTSGFLAFIRDEHYQPLAAEAAMADGTGNASPKFSDRRLDTTLTLKAGVEYVIVMEVWTTKSVGIYTTGGRATGVVGSATYTVRYAHSDTADHIDRGAIAFELLD